MPEFRQIYDDEIQGHSLSQGHCKDSAGMSTSIRLLLLNIVRIGGIVVKKCGEIFSSIWFDSHMVLPVTNVQYSKVVHI